MLASLLLLLSLLSPPGTSPGDLTHWTAHPLIAHALGGIEGADLTNSREALESNYARGFRVFETDLMMTRDQQHLVARHDWEDKQFIRFAQDQYFPTLKTWNPLSLQEFKELPILNRYSGMEWTDMLEFMVVHPDMYFVLDTKFTDESSIRKQYKLVAEAAKRIDPALLEHVIPQIYNQKMLATVDSIHSFPSYIYTLYQTQDTNQQVLNFVKANPRIQAVTMAGSRATKTFIQSLNKLSVRSYVHTINDLSTYQKYQKNGVFGIYTDFIGYKDLLKGKKGSWTAKPPLPPEEKIAANTR
jgi:glycerophosphoryl diester phosphodiesterase